MRGKIHFKKSDVLEQYPLTSPEQGTSGNHLCHAVVFELFLCMEFAVMLRDNDKPSLMHSRLVCSQNLPLLPV